MAGAQPALTALGIYHLFGPLTAVLAALLLKRQTGSYMAANLFVLLLASSVFFWDLAVEASDFLPLGCLLLIVLLALYSTRPTSPRVVLASVVLGMAATSRVPFLYLPLLYGAIIYPRDRKAAALTASLGTATAAAFHFVFYMWCRSEGLIYQPLHVLTKGAGLLPPAQMAGGLALCLFVGLMIVRYSKMALDRWLLLLWLGLFTPLAVVSAADLARSGFARWEGANYLLPPLPVFVAYALLRVSSPPSPGRPGRER